MAGRAAGAEKSGVFSPNRQRKAGVPQRGGQTVGRVWRPFSPDICAAAARKPFDTRSPNRIPLSEFYLVPPTRGYPLRGLTPAAWRFV